MSLPPPRASEIAHLTDALLAGRTVQVRLTALWTHWAAAAPRLIGDPTQAASLAKALRELAARGIIELPSAAWDRSTDPPLPRSIRLPANRRPPPHRPWIRFPWRAELGWASSLPTLSEALFADLVAINGWLTRVTNHTPTVVPMRFRSAEIFGEEKRLEALARSELFGPERLSLRLLACSRLAAPLPAVAIGSGPDVLVVENSDPYWAAVAALRLDGQHRIGAVAWGMGNAFPSQVSTLGHDVAGRGPVQGTVWYWGDLDPDGVTTAITAAAAAATATAHIAPVRPATALWSAMAHQPPQRVGSVNWGGITGQDWFGAALWNQLGVIRKANARVAQEAVPVDTIRDWAATI